MFKVVRFVVVPYERPDGARGEARQFYTLGEAKAVRDAALKRCVRVELFKVTGWPSSDLWDRPQEIA